MGERGEGLTRPCTRYLLRVCATLPVVAIRGTPPAGSLRFAVSGVAPGGAAWANVFWIATTVAAPTTAQMNTMTSSLYSAWKTAFQGLLGDNWTITLAKSTYYGTAPYVITGEHVATDVGTVGGDSTMPDQVTAVLSWLISTTWRGGKPRTYFPGIVSTSDLVDNAHITGTHVTTLETQATAWMTAVNAYTTSPFLTMVLGTIRFFSAGEPLAPPVFLPYTGSFVHPRIGTMRKRLGRET